MREPSNAPTPREDFMTKELLTFGNGLAQAYIQAYLQAGITFGNRESLFQGKFILMIVNYEPTFWEFSPDSGISNFLWR